MADYYDISLDFSLDAKGDIALATDEAAIVQSIENIILSPKGFKSGSGPVNRIFGIGINKYVFAPMTDFVANSLGGNIYRQLKIFEPRIEIDNINIDMNIDDRFFEVTLYYRIKPLVSQFTYKTVINQI